MALATSTGLANYERCEGGKHKIADRHEIFGDEEVGRKHDQVEADKEEDCWGERFPELVQNSDTRAVCDPHYFRAQLPEGVAYPTLIVIQNRPCPHVSFSCMRIFHCLAVGCIRCEPNSSA